jgi:glycosyltransferase involved in cell wall biosynthesis
VGGGEPHLEDLLRRSGVRVTGWLARRQALEHLRASDVYVHTAAWDGAPITVLEAAAAGVPVLARRTSAMEALGVEPLFDSAGELAALVGQLPGGSAVDLATRCGRRLRETHTAEAQSRALHRVYRLAAEAGSAGRRPPPT